MIAENIADITLIILLVGLLYIYKTRGFTKHGKFAKPSNTYFWFQVGLLVFLFLWQPWNE
jgi:uncharacterized membrane protein (DUF373 family)